MIERAFIKQTIALFLISSATLVLSMLSGFENLGYFGLGVLASALGNFFVGALNSEKIPPTPSEHSVATSLSHDSKSPLGNSESK